MGDGSNNIAQFMLKLTVTGTGDLQIAATSINNIGDASVKAAANIRSGGVELDKIPGIAKTASTSLLALNGSIGAIANTLIGGFGLEQLLGVGRAAAEIVRETEHLAVTLGSSVEDASKLAFAAQRTGASLDTLRMAAFMASSALQSAQQGAGNAAAGFRELGIDPNGVSGLPDLFMKVADALANSTDSQTAKLQALKEIFGRSAKDMFLLLQEGSGHIKELMKQAEESGLVIDETIAAEVRKFNGDLAVLQQRAKLGIGLPVVEFINAHKEIAGVVVGLGALYLAVRGIQGLGLPALVASITERVIAATAALRVNTTAFVENAAAQQAVKTAATGAAAATGMISGVGLPAAIAIITGYLIYQADELRQSEEQFRREAAAVSAAKEARRAYYELIAAHEQKKDITEEQVTQAVGKETAEFKELYARLQDLLAKQAEIQKWKKQFPGFDYKDYTDEINQVSELIAKSVGRAINLQTLPTVEKRESAIKDLAEYEKEQQGKLSLDKAYLAQKRIAGELAVKEEKQTELQNLQESYLETIRAKLAELRILSDLRDRYEAAKAENNASKNPDDKLAKDLQTKLIEINNQIALKKVEGETQAMQALTRIREAETNQVKNAAASEIALLRAQNKEKEAIEKEYLEKIRAARLRSALPAEIDNLEKERDIALLKSRLDQAEKATKAAQENYQRTSAGVQAGVAVGRQTPAEAQRELAVAAAAYAAALKSELAGLQAVADATGKNKARIAELRLEIAKFDSANQKLARDTDNVGLGLSAGFESAKASVKGWGEVTHDEFLKGINDSVSFGSELATHPEKWKDAGRAATQFFSNLLSSIAQAILQAMIMRALFGTASGGGGLLSFMKMESGGVMTGDGPVPLRRYAGGGIASQPQMAMFGEGSTPEAYVPLPDGRSIPVSLDLAAIHDKTANRTFSAPSINAGNFDGGAAHGAAAPAPQVHVHTLAFVGHEAMQAYYNTTEGRSMINGMIDARVPQIARRLDARSRGMG